MSYQKITGPLMANSHPGSYCGQDAYNDMLVTENESIFVSENRRVQGFRSGINAIGSTVQGLDRPDSARRGGDDAMEQKTIVRRLSELECERLQGFPDNWTLIGEPDENGDYWWTDSTGKRRKVTSSARYKALGNSIATPFWRYLARRIMAQYEHEVTMGSLFDGIGGFPYVFQQCGCRPVWASEIEEYPIAVTKAHFPEEEI